MRFTIDPVVAHAPRTGGAIGPLRPLPTRSTVQHHGIPKHTILCVYDP